PLPERGLPHRPLPYRKALARRLCHRKEAAGDDALLLDAQSSVDTAQACKPLAVCHRHVSSSPALDVANGEACWCPRRKKHHGRTAGPQGWIAGGDCSRKFRGEARRSLNEG